MDDKTIEINNSFKKTFQVGEIYNHSELRKFLEGDKRGFIFGFSLR